jgi:hypothetical protein
MKKIMSKDDKPLHHNSFILLRPESDYYKIDEPFDVIDQNQYYQGLFYLRSIKTYTLKDLPEIYTYLDSDVDKNLFLEIQQKVYDTYKRVTLQECPEFTTFLKDLIGKENYKLFEFQIFKSFKPLTLNEIYQLYKDFEFHDVLLFKKIRSYILMSFPKKKISVLLFSQRLPEKTLEEKYNQQIYGYAKRRK